MGVDSRDGNVEQPLYGEARLYINGQMQFADSHYSNISPATGKVIGIAADASAQDCEAAIVAARVAFDQTDWSTNHAFRLQCLRRFQRAMLRQLKPLQDAVVAEAGSTRHNAETVQVNGPVEMATWCLDYLEQFEWQQDLGEYTLNSLGSTSRRLVCKEAAGVVAAITPWNFPLQIILAKVMPALAAGCTVVLKAAPDTPWSAALLGRIAHGCGLPAGVFNVLTANNAKTLGGLLCRDPRIDVVSFTGSTAVGKQVMSDASGSVKRVFLELGGKSPHILLDDADFSSALLNCLAVCFHAGQGCVIATRVLVPQQRLEEVEGLLCSYFDFISYGDPEAPGAIMGPLINERQRQRVLSMIEQAKQEGARLIKGGGTPDELLQGFYVQPTIFVDETATTCVAREEVFGPVLTIIPYTDEADALRIANDSQYGLGAVVNSADEARAIAFARGIRAGIVNVNNGNFLAPDVPFGGYKQSGIGREMGAEGFAEYLETKTIAIGA
ncbi:aldehyde dehydrogenase (NAD+) [Sinobacterium caligoides]|uniref:Aldehyde dehydrogenase (NAD+) n=1 Tax=Sinobacterium caligoides TaxID=933926 RepID=A0A3N2DN41_9GAMM|nr:aldehyde dehydrogenase family protein [Sinobacterium caligoides]ROS01223.1 aldehyde dehydrogenase (NAD+) [Sinobacterium caligoides]